MKECKPLEWTNVESFSQYYEKANFKSSSQSSELVNYGTQPDARVQSFEDYDWDQDRKVKYRRNDKGGFHQL